MDSNEFSRRDFLKLSALGACGLCLAGCGVRTSAPPKEYWEANKKKLMEDFDSIITPARSFIGEKLSPEETGEVAKEAKANYESLLPQVPFIGGDDNQLTEVLYMSAAGLALYQAMQAHGQDVDETGRVMYRVMEKLFTFNDPMISAHLRNPTGKEEQDSYRIIEKWTAKSPYPGDWKMTFVDGDGESFDFGVDYTECGVVKFYKAHGAFDLAKYMCLGDFPISQSTGTGLVRTTTLGSGGSKCDFRFKAGRPIHMEWTPDFLK
jgi:hypothetical protein